MPVKTHELELSYITVDGVLNYFSVLKLYLLEICH